MLGTRVSKLSVSSFEDDGYGMMVRYGHVFLYRRDEPVRTTVLLGDRKDGLYVLRGHIVRPGSGWLSKSESEDEDNTAFDRYGREEDSDSLQSTGRRLSQSSDGAYDQVDETQVESQDSEFQFEVEHLFPRLIPEQEGAVAGVRDGDSAADLPR